MPRLDLIDETFIAAAPSDVAAVVHDASAWSQLWPGLELSVSDDRAQEGIRWTCAGPLIGSAEVWLQPHGDGVIVHCYLRVDPPANWSPRTLRRESLRRQWQVKAAMFALKDRLEADRFPGGKGFSPVWDLPTPPE